METTPLERRPVPDLKRRWLVLAMLILSTLALAQSPSVQQLPPETHRKAVQTVTPSYPEIAKTLKLVGTVRLAVKVAPSGKVVSAEVLGGHPVLVRAAVEAVLQWRYQAGPQPTSEVAVVNFER